MDRRNFLRTGGMAVLGSLAMPSLAMPGSVRGALGGADSKSAVAAANHFGVTEADLKKVMAVALEKGGDYADLYFEHTFNNSVSLMDGKVNNCGSNIDFGMGVRVLSGDQSGYAYVEGVTLEEMLRAARTAARIASSGRAGKPDKEMAYQKRLVAGGCHLGHKYLIPGIGKRLVHVGIPGMDGMSHLMGQGKHIVKGAMEIQQHIGMAAVGPPGISAAALAFIFIDINPPAVKSLL